METPQPPAQDRKAELIDVAIRLGLVAVLAWMALRVFQPFLLLMIWAMVLGIALYPLNQKIAAVTGGSNTRAATLLVLLLVLLLGVPTVVMIISLGNHVLTLYQSVEAGSLKIQPPNPEVADWPVVGKQLFAAWQEASENIVEFAAEHQEQLREFTRKAAGALGSGLTTILGFIGSFIIAGVMMAYAHPGAETSQRIFKRVCGPRAGPELHKLSVDTVRSVAVGVVGVAFIQAVLLGIGFMFGGIPFAGLLALLAMILGIAQIPAALIVVPALLWMWMAGDGSNLTNIVVTVYLLVAGLADNVLKPLLLGRGLAVPMPVILLGALGGMFVSGLIGLFTGAVILAVAYQVFMAWVNEGAPESPADAPAE